MIHKQVAALALTLALALVAGCSGESEAKLLESAKSYIAAKDYKAATIQLKTLLQKNPQSASARLLLGKAFLETGDGTAALVELKKAKELAVADDQVLPEMARAMLLVGEHAKVSAQFGQTRLGTAAAQADLLTSIAFSYAMQGQLDKAREATVQALQAQPQHPPAAILQARLKAAGNDLDGALRQLDEVLAREPGNDSAGTLKGELLWRGRRDEAGALAAFRKVLESKPNAVPAHTSIVAIHTELGRPADAKSQFQALKKVAANHPDTLLIEAQQALQEGNPTLTREIAARLLKALPDNPRVLVLAGAAEYRLNAYVQAEAFLGRALTAAPGHLGARQLLAQTYLRTNQSGKALDALRPVLEGSNADGASLALAGEAYMQSGDTRRADQAFQLAAKAAPDDTRVRTAVALAQYARGETTPALEALQAIAADDKGHRADLALISARMRAKDTAGALKAVEALRKKMPDRPLPDLLRGRVLVQKNDLAGASAAFEAALKKDPKFVPAASGLAGLDLVAGKVDAARQRLQELIKIDPNNYEIHLALAEITARSGGTGAEVAKVLAAAVKATPTHPAPRLAQVEHLMRMGDTQATLTAAQEGSAALPQSLELLSALGRAQLASGNGQQAIATFGQLVGKQPREAVHHLRIADAHMLANDLNSAKASLRKTQELDPNSLAAKRGLAAIALRQSKPDEARAIARELQKAQPKEASGYQLEGDVERQLRNWPAALVAYRKAFALARTTDMAIRLHQTHLSGGQRAEADRLAADWQKERAADYAFRYYLGDLATTRADYAVAEAHYRAVLEAQPRNALAMNNVAWLMAKQGKAGAVKAAEQALQILPNRPQLMDTLATALAAEGDVKRAIDTQRQAVNIDRKDNGLRLNLARLYLKAGEKAPALAELEDLARLGDKFAAQAEVAQLLKLAR